MNTRDLLDRVARDWRGARPDVDPTPMLTVISIQRVSALLDRELERFFALHDLTPANFDVLATLRRSAPPEGLLPSVLGTLMAITPPAITKRVDALEARGLVERTSHATDRRAILVRLTGEGRARVDQVLALHVANEDRVLGDLDEADRARLRELLGRVAARLEQD
ncbi:MarR family winged helix-turn-helix transcriptional regulator [Deinococcus pimensis]|uniref:MarR family winged helix-turn-helix transcriptional regulator n=1 Tax=Deinococcus pimensis TaxID=309888 RepID=UPI000484CB3E|nr:MarR family transcriptional regulator [Deinococcus pimensis]